MVILMVPGFVMFLGGAMCAPMYGDPAVGIAAVGAAVMLLGACG